MNSTPLTDLNQAQRDRLAFIDLRVQFLGGIGRQDLVSRFGIQTAAASRDLAQYKAIAPDNLFYDAKLKAYLRREGFRPVFTFPVLRVLNWLCAGYGDGEPMTNRPLVAHATTEFPSHISLDVLATLTRAIHQRVAVHATYRSLQGGLTASSLVPFALVTTGKRWQVRAYDRRRACFADFVLARIESAEIEPGPLGDHEAPEQDLDWMRLAELELVAHPVNVQHPETIEREWGMQGGVLKVRVRAAVAGYLLRDWNVDCSSNHRITGTSCHLWLRNPKVLWGVSNMKFAPGYDG